MASCEYYIELLSAGLDGQLTQEQEQELAGHLLECPYCRELGPQLVAAHAAFANMEEIPAPEGFAEGVMKEIRSRENPNKVVPLFKRPVWKAVAGLAACCVLCFGAYRSGMSPQNSADSGTGEQPALAQEWNAAGEGASVYVPEGARVDDREVSGVGAVMTVGVTYGSTPNAPAAVVLENKEMLDLFLEEFPEDDHMVKVSQSYEDAYFQSGRLLAVVLEGENEFITHQIIGITPEQVTILRDVPEDCTGDVAAWLILAEVDGDFKAADAVAVVLETE